MVRPLLPRLSLTGLVLAWLVSACSAGRPTSAATAPAPATAPARVRGSDGAVAPLAMTVPLLAGYELAMSRGTRTRTGAPGPRYWQQWADYKLEAELNPVSKRMTGKGAITYYNR